MGLDQQRTVTGMACGLCALVEIAVSFIHCAVRAAHRRLQTQLSLLHLLGREFEGENKVADFVTYTSIRHQRVFKLRFKLGRICKSKSLNQLMSAKSRHVRARREQVGATVHTVEWLVYHSLLCGNSRTRVTFAAYSNHKIKRTDVQG